MLGKNGRLDPATPYTCVPGEAPGGGARAVNNFATKAQLVSVAENNDDRGVELKERFDALGISYREWDERTGIDRQTLSRAFQGRSQDSTYTAIDAELTRLERHVRGIPEDAPTPEEDYVEFTAEGNFGVRVVVRGPVRNMDALREAVSKLIEDMKTDNPGHSDI